MNPIEYIWTIFSEEHTPNFPAIKLHNVTYREQQRKWDVLQYLSIISKLYTYMYV